MASVNFQKFNIYQTNGVTQKSVTTNPIENSSGNEVSKPAFKAEAYKTNATVRTSLTTKDEKKKYEELSNELNLEYRRKLEFALKSGQLLKNNSNDKSSVLENLHKIITG